MSPRRLEVKRRYGNRLADYDSKESYNKPPCAIGISNIRAVPANRCLTISKAAATCRPSNGTAHRNCLPRTAYRRWNTGARLHDLLFDLRRRGRFFYWQFLYQHTQAQARSERKNATRIFSNDCFSHASTRTDRESLSRYRRCSLLLFAKLLSSNY